MLVALKSDAYASVLGIERPVWPVTAVVVLGFLGWFVVSHLSWIPSRTEGALGYRLAVLIGLMLPIPVIIVDWYGGFGQAINAPAPASLLFYPSLAVVAELVLHVIPLAFAATLTILFPRAERALKVFGLGAAVVIEPILQMMWGAELSPIWANTYVGVQLLAFNIIGVYLLRRFGILRVLIFRLSYYFVWHILWGYLRSDLLFAK